MSIIDLNLTHSMNKTRELTDQNCRHLNDSDLMNQQELMGAKKVFTLFDPEIKALIYISTK